MNKMDNSSQITIFSKIMDMNDIYARFLLENSTESYEKFKDWYEDNFPDNINIPDRFSFQDFIIKQSMLKAKSSFNDIKFMNLDQFINPNENNITETYVYYVDGVICDGMQGINLFLGIFTTSLLAEKKY